MSSYSISDDETRTAIKEVFLNNNYLLDPHGAVGYLGLKEYLQSHTNMQGIFLETAHPVKFYDVVEPVIGKQVPMPKAISHLLNQEKCSVKMGVEYIEFKEYLLS